MPLSWNEIKSNALAFTKRWEDEGSERAEAQSFWNEFFAIFGIDRRRVAIFEKQVRMTGADRKIKHGRIDCFWKGMLLVEHKSAGQDLERALNPKETILRYLRCHRSIGSSFPWRSLVVR